MHQHSQGKKTPYRSHGVPQPHNLRQRLLPPDIGAQLPGAHARAEDFDRRVPEGLVLGVQEEDEARGLRVEGAGDVEDGGCEEGFDCWVGDGGGVAEGVDCAARLCGGEEGGDLGWGHFGGVVWLGADSERWRGVVFVLYIYKRMSWMVSGLEMMQ